jgi:DNA-binding NarL/FixJ family response regulator
VRIHPGGFRLVLVGPKVSRLLPFLQSRGFVAEAFARGGEAQARLRTAPCHVLIVELELGDMLGVELGRAARQDRQAGAVMLMDDPAKSGMVVAALARGLETFVPIPPDEAAFLERIELLLLAQWGLVVTQQQAQLLEELGRAKETAQAAEEKLALAEHDRDEREAKAQKDADERVARVEAQLRDARKQADEAKRSVDAAVDKARVALQSELVDERKKVEQLRRETAVLRDQLTSMHLVTGAKTGVSEEGPPALVDGNDDALDDALFAGGTMDGEDDAGSAAVAELDDDDEMATAQFELPTKAGSTSLQRPSAKPAAATPPAKLAAARGAAAPAPSAAAASPRPSPAPIDPPTGARGFGTAVPTTPAAAALRTTGTSALRAASGAAAVGDDEFAPATVGGPRTPASSGGPPSFDDRTAPFPKEQLAAGVGSDLEPPTMQTRAHASGRGRVPAAVFDDDAEATLTRAPAAAPKNTSFKANDEDTAPGGHSISQVKSQIAADEKKKVLQKEQARAASPQKPDALFSNLSDLPSLDEEVLFLEDE